MNKEELMYRLLSFLDEVADVSWFESGSDGVNAGVIILIAVIVIAAIVLIARSVMKKKRE